MFVHMCFYRLKSDHLSHFQILDPLAGRFRQLTAADKNAATTESNLLDVLDCFRGVAQATQIHSAEFLFSQYRLICSE